MSDLSDCRLRLTQQNCSTRAVTHRVSLIPAVCSAFWRSSGSWRIAEMGASASVPDKLFVFVSSTIGECAEERRVAREAIESLNHEPFLFEDAGARPYPPRELYLPKLES